MKYVNKEKIINAAKRSWTKLGVQQLIFADDSFVTIAACLPEVLLDDGEHILEVVYDGYTVYSDDYLTDAAFEKVDAFVVNYIENVLKKPVIKIEID